tara:strand:- start:31 stop:435 length:405 start_codon:yes stop_codon:yes gene_type:complete
MKKIRIFCKIVFYFANIILITLYLYPGSIFGCYLYDNCYRQPQVTKNFIAGNFAFSANHVYVFVLLTSLGVFSFHDTNKINLLTLYLFLLSIILELFHIIIPNRGFEMMDLFGNIVGVILVVFTYKIIIRHDKI